MKTIIILLYFIRDLHSFSPTVRIEEGELIGKQYDLENGKTVHAFLGIPYAEPPTSDLRFQEPQRVKPWKSVWNATYLREKCLQISFEPEIVYKISGKEDCLYLNVFTPKLPTQKNQNLYDVLVFIHGGGLSFGSGNLYPDYLFRNNSIVFVTMNYRLGAFGFLNIDNEVFGNYGLKDQVLALKWVKKNIIKFGGNPESITLVGHSAGGGCVHYHIISPSSAGLFQKAISMSSTALCSWAWPKNGTQKALRLAALVGCSTKAIADTMKCLRQKPAEEIIEAAKNFLVVSGQPRHPHKLLKFFRNSQSWRYFPMVPFAPAIERNNPNAFLPDEPLELIRTKKINDIPWMVTMVKNEGLSPIAEFIHSDVYLKQLEDGWNEIAPNLLFYNYDIPENQKNIISSAIKNFYFGEKAISKNTTDELVQCAGDRFFFHGIIKGSAIHNSVTTSSTYCYQFNYRGKYSVTDIYDNNSIDYGVSHTDDLILILKGLLAKNIDAESDEAVSRLLVSMIVDFMKFGNPNTVVPEWESIRKERTSYLNCLAINSATDLKMKNIPIDTPSSEFWEKILPWERLKYDRSQSYRPHASKSLLLCIFTTFMYRI